MMRQVVAPILAGIAAAVAATCHTSCKPREARHPDADAVYATQVIECVQKAKTLEESKECRRNVNRAWGLCEQKNLRTKRSICEDP